MRRPSLQYSSAYNRLCAFVQTTQPTCSSRSYRFDRGERTASTPLEAPPLERPVQRAAHGTRARLKCLLLRWITASRKACAAVQCVPGFSCAAPDQRQRPGRHVGRMRGQSAAGGCNGRWMRLKRRWGPASGTKESRRDCDTNIRSFLRAIFFPEIGSTSFSETNDQ
jgi:hypothetical protein